MRRREFLLSSGVAALGLSAFPARWVSAAGTKKQRVLYFTRSQGFEHSVVRRKGDELAHSEKILTDLGKRSGCEVVCTKDGRVFDGDLDQWDAFAFYTTGDLTKPDKQNDAPMSPQGKQRLLDAIAAGKGFIGFHSATDTFHSRGPHDENQAQPDPYIAMIGGEFIIHGRQWNAAVTPTSPKFPGTAGLGDSFRVLEEWYALKNFAKDLHVVLVQETEGMNDPCYRRAPYPETWARTHEQGRVFYTSFGHREDIWTNPKIQDLILGGMAWILRNVNADVTPNIDAVTPQAREIPKLPPPAKKPTAPAKKKPAAAN
jgi:type 1 glutamine amidotransferase